MLWVCDKRGKICSTILIKVERISFFFILLTWFMPQSGVVTEEGSVTGPFNFWLVSHYGRERWSGAHRGVVWGAEEVVAHFQGLLPLLRLPPPPLLPLLLLLRRGQVSTGKSVYFYKSSRSVSALSCVWGMRMELSKAKARSDVGEKRGRTSERASDRRAREPANAPTNVHPYV